MRPFLLIPKLHVHNANALSGSYIIGFPAMTAWLGFVHALQRKLQADGFPEIDLCKVAVSCHDCNVQVYKGEYDYKYSIIGTSNPLKKKGKEFERPPFIEEPRCHLVVSLLIELNNLAVENDKLFLHTVQELLPQLKAAGGDIEKISTLQILYVDEDEPQTTSHAVRCLMPGYVIIDRSDLLKEPLPEGKDTLDQLLDVLSVRFTPKEHTGADTIPQWSPQKQQPGWLVPLAVGFKDISGPMRVRHQRSYDYEHHFAESVVTICEFKMPFHFRDLEEIMWHYQTIPQLGLYLCKNSNQWNTKQH